ncbi:redoxin family protein [Demequina phytophila]|uniref:redoxin family protein n=1 Tax=Demequina phytophila TaxID=1638981 RepID=UPI0007855674|nr:redoxin family protein [Demequina phytophila]
MRGATVLAIAGGLTLVGCSSGQGDDAVVPAAASSPAAVVETARATPVPTGTAATAEPAVGPAFDFTAATVDGGTFEGASIDNTDVILWFWAPWCPTCVAEAPVILDAAQRLPDGVEIVGVAGLSGDQEYMREFVELTGTQSLTHVADLDGAIWKGFDISTQATIVVIDDSGDSYTLGAGITADELVGYADKIAAT